MENLPIKSVRDKELRYITPEEYQQLISYSETSDIFKKDRTILLIKLLWNTGARISEALSLKVKDIDFKSKTITITVLKKDAIFKYKRLNLTPKEITKYRIKNYIQLNEEQEAKLANNEAINLTNSQVKEWHSKLPPTLNTIPLNQDFLNELELYILRHSLQKTDLIIKLGRSQAWKIVRQLTKTVLNKQFHPHSFRHGFAMSLLNKNVPAPVIQSLLKHSSLNTTFNTYAIPTLEMKRKALENR